MQYNHRPLTEEESRALAKHIVAEMIKSLGEEENVSRIANVWGRYLDQWIGKNFRRLVVLIAMALTLLVAVKVQVWNLFGR